MSVGKFRGFRSSIPAHQWKRMTPQQRNNHKAKQVAYIKHKSMKRVLSLATQYPRHYATVHRKARSSSIAVSSDIVKRVGEKLKNTAYHSTEMRSASNIYAWKHELHTVAVRTKKKNCKPFRKFTALFGMARSTWNLSKDNSNLAICEFTKPGAESSRLVYWNLHLPIFYFSYTSGDYVIDTDSSVCVFSRGGSVWVDKAQYGSLLLVVKGAPVFSVSGALREYEITKFSNSIFSQNCSVLAENTVINAYSALAKLSSTYLSMSPTRRKFITSKDQGMHKRGYIKHIVRMRYRWFFQPKLSQFKLFKKFFKRTLKRYRKIYKNKLFVSKLRAHFPKLTGFTEKGLLKLWLPFRRNYNEYWSAGNAVRRFSQSLLLTPRSLLVFLQLSPSFAASKHIIKSGAVSINGLAVTAFTQFRPGDIMQLNFVIWRSVRHFFDYQRWNNDFRGLRHVSFLQVDWSSLMFMMVRWPRKYELVAPSFLSERWIRYYIRQFPAKIRNFRKADGNWKVYKRTITKR